MKKQPKFHICKNCGAKLTPTVIPLHKGRSVRAWRRVYE